MVTGVSRLVGAVGPFLIFFLRPTYICCIYCSVCISKPTWMAYIYLRRRDRVSFSLLAPSRQRRRNLSEGRTGRHVIMERKEGRTEQKAQESEGNHKAHAVRSSIVTSSPSSTTNPIYSVPLIFSLSLSFFPFRVGVGRDKLPSFFYPADASFVFCVWCAFCFFLLR